MHSSQANSHMNKACESCRGACCESLVLNLPVDGEVRVWLSLRGRVENDSVRITAPCTKLRDGACSIYDERPLPCRVFAVGSPQCIASIRSCRPKDAARLIRLARENQTSNQAKEPTK